METQGDWFPIYLKQDEAQFFLDELKAHQKYPKLLLFYLSAFLSSARSITFHIQNQIVPNAANGRVIYDNAVKELLGDDVSKYFINLRNTSEKQIYLPLGFRLYRTEYEVDDPRNVWTQLGASVPSSTPSVEHMTTLEELLTKTASWHGTPHIQTEWYLDDFSGAEQELTDACKTYLASLRSFVDEFRHRLLRDG